MAAGSQDSQANLLFAAAPALGRGFEVPAGHGSHFAGPQVTGSRIGQGRIAPRQLGEQLMSRRQARIGIVGLFEARNLREQCQQTRLLIFRQ